MFFFFSNLLKTSPVISWNIPLICIRSFVLFSSFLVTWLLIFLLFCIFILPGICDFGIWGEAQQLLDPGLFARVPLLLKLFFFFFHDWS